MGLPHPSHLLCGESQAPSDLGIPEESAEQLGTACREHFTLWCKQNSPDRARRGPKLKREKLTPEVRGRDARPGLPRRLAVRLSRSWPLCVLLFSPLRGTCDTCLSPSPSQEHNPSYARASASALENTRWYQRQLECGTYSALASHSPSF